MAVDKWYYCKVRYRNSDRGKQTMKAWVESHAEEIRLKQQEYYQKNKERIKRNAKSWKARNPERVRASNEKRNAVKRGASRSDWFLRREVYLRDNGTCSYCKMNLPTEGWHMDHVVPLSRGGTHSLDNVVVACRDCNLSKAARLLQ